jgi:O-antigen/teichoic acid export membrane protein
MNEREPARSEVRKPTAHRRGYPSQAITVNRRADYRCHDMVTGAGTVPAPAWVAGWGVYRRRMSRVGTAIRETGAVAVGTSVANALGYVLTVVGARVLGPAEFGAFGALLALVIADSVAALAVQATTARSTARGQAVVPVIRAGLAIALVVGLALALLSPLLREFLQLSSVVPALAVAVGIAALTATAPAMGIVQGAERFHVLAVLVAGQALLRVAGGLIGMAVEPTAAGALVGIAAGLVVAGAGCWLVARPPLQPAELRMLGVSIRSTLASGGMLLGFVLLTNADVFLARHVLPAQQSGLYAAGAVFTKIAFWLPQFVPLVAFPALTDPRRRRGAVRLGLSAVIGCGAALVAGVALFPDVAVQIVAGEQYVALTPWAAWFTALGALLAVAQLLVYAHLASGDRLTTAVIWGILVAYVAVVELTADTLPRVLIPTMCAAALVVLWGLLRERSTRRTGS